MIYKLEDFKKWLAEDPYHRRSVKLDEEDLKNLKIDDEKVNSIHLSKDFYYKYLDRADFQALLSANVLEEQEWFRKEELDKVHSKGVYAILETYREWKALVDQEEEQKKKKKTRVKTYD